MSAPALHRPRPPWARGARRRTATLAVLGAALAVLLVLSLGTPEFPVSPGAALDVALGHGDPSTTLFLEELRLPRVVAGVLVGLALGVAGALFQSLTRNPLGSPDMIGFTAGSAAGAVGQILLFGGGGTATALAALVGGLLTGIVIYALAVRGGLDGFRLILIGIALSAMLMAVCDYLVARADLDEARGAQVWLTGSLNGREWEQVVPLAIGVLALLPLLALLGRDLRTAELGDDVARGLGVPLTRSRTLALAIGVALTAMATAAAGPVIFVALAAPQIARRLTGATGPGLAAAGLTGAVLLSGSDRIAERALPSGPVPVGVVTGVAGGVFLVWLLAIGRRRAPRAGRASRRRVRLLPRRRDMAS